MTLRLDACLRCGEILAGALEGAILRGLVPTPAGHAVCETCLSRIGRELVAESIPPPPFPPELVR